MELSPFEWEALNAIAERLRQFVAQHAACFSSPQSERALYCIADDLRVILRTAEARCAVFSRASGAVCADAKPVLRNFTHRNAVVALEQLHDCYDLLRGDPARVLERAYLSDATVALRAFVEECAVREEEP